MIELQRLNKSLLVERLLLLHIPRTGGQSLLRLMLDSGWERSERFEVSSRHSNHFEIRATYKQLGESIPDSLAVVRHPMRRIESAFFKDHRAKSPRDMWDQLRAMKVEEIYLAFNRQLRPAVDMVHDKSFIWKYEEGLTKLRAALLDRNWVKRSAELKHFDKSNKPLLNWRESPQDVIEKIMKVYAQDFYEFQYRLFPEDEGH